ncbi:probable protein phosphatase 2C 4 [Typha angustifolia]|uniref:probable protein phosphatase 2C 4 n=1 Tax=Typha angustifolia TaxID=59011 RepID=UPI003C2B66E8
MGNGYTKLTHCFTCGGGTIRRRHVAPALPLDTYDEGLGHSFCYVRPDSTCSHVSSKVHHHAEEATTTTFSSISGAALSANPSTLLSTSLLLTDSSSCSSAAAAAFESSDSFASVPLQPVPRFASGPLSGFSSGPIERGFMSGPIERGFMSGPLDPRAAPLFSGPLEKPSSPSSSARLRRSFSHGGHLLLRRLSKAISATIPKESKFPSKKEFQDATFIDTQDGNLQWAQGKAGEDRVHVVVSDEHGWVFVGIYDGFNGPDATDYLLTNLYSAVHSQLKGLLWEDKDDVFREPSDEDSNPSVATNWIQRRRTRRGKGGKKWEENQRKWKCERDKERSDLDRRLNDNLSRSISKDAISHLEVLKALAMALKKTEEAYLGIADKMVSENPELALMGSCVLVMLMKGDDVYFMNVGDSRAVLATNAEPDSRNSFAKAKQDLERINEESFNDLGGYGFEGLPSLAALQLTLDHTTCVEEEVRRIKNKHPDDAAAIANDRVKGSLKVTRAFGAGFLKQPKWNNALLEMFRIDYVGTSPYITCNPSLYHHKLGPKDRFLILSSDGLYQYFTNEEAVAQVEMFITTNPEGDPAQHLVEEVLFRAAEKAGMDFHELLEIPQGDRRRYHDDVSIIVISLEGRIWRSQVDIYTD